MQTRTLGTDGPEVSALGLGCMGMSDLYGPANEDESIATIHAALDAGVTLIDTYVLPQVTCVNIDLYRVQSRGEGDYGGLCFLFEPGYRVIERCWCGDVGMHEGASARCCSGACDFR